MLLFGAPPEMPKGATISLVLKEKGAANDTNQGVVGRLGKGLISSLKVLGEAVQGRGTMGVPKATSDAVDLAKAVAGAAAGASVQLRLPLKPYGEFWRSGSADGPSISCKVRYLDYQALRAEWLGSQDLTDVGHGENSPVQHSSLKQAVYDAVGTRQLLHMECPEVLQVVWDFYDRDPLYDSTGHNDKPPIKRVLAVHGVNVKTEVQFALRVNTQRLKPDVLCTRFILDDETELVKPVPGVSIAGGIVYEEPGGWHPAGDGVVPFASMEHCRAWGSDMEVSVEHVDGCSHRELLTHPRFMEVLSEAVRPGRAPRVPDTSTASEPAPLFPSAPWTGAPPGPSASLPSGGGGRRWQASKDKTQTVWWDFPPEVSTQLTAASQVGLSKVEVEIRGQAYEIDLRSLVQKNVATGTERSIRVVE